MSARVISIRKELLALFGAAAHKGVLVALAERADENGFLRISVNAFAKEIGVGRQIVRTVLGKLESNQYINQWPANGITNISFCYKAQCATLFPTEKPTANQARSQHKTSERFVRPTIEEVRQYISEKGYGIDADYFWNYYESVNWMRGKTKIKNWKLTLATWNNNHYGNSKKQLTTEDKYAPRRGTDVGNHTEADYGGPF